MSVPAHPHFLFFHYRWPRGSHHRDWKYGYYYFYVCIVNGKLAVQDASARLNPINGSLTYSQLRKYGKVVTISFRLTDCDIPYGTVICTLPEGYIPSTTWISIFGQVYDGSSWISGSITIDLGGNIRQEITQNNTKMCIFSGAFITD